MLPLLLSQVKAASPAVVSQCSEDVSVHLAHESWGACPKKRSLHFAHCGVPPVLSQLQSSQLSGGVHA